MSIRYIFVILFTVLFACSDELKQDNCPQPDVTPTTIQVLPLGDSRVEGGRPDFESYRYWLWSRLVQNSWEVDFIGTRSDDADYPDVSGRCFDNEHEGTGGAITTDILNTLEDATFQPEPEVALLGIGGNDLLETGRSVAEIIGTMNEIIDNLQARNANITILVEQIAPGKSNFMTPEATNRLNQFNAEIINVASAQTTNTSKVVAINMASGWQDSYLADDVHYNETGADIVGARYFNAFEANVSR